MISNKLASIPHIEFVDEFKDVGSKAFMFLVLTKVVKELVQVSNVRILIIQYFKIRSQVFFNLGRKIRCEQVSISMFWNLENKIHLKREGNVITLDDVLDKLLFELFEFRVSDRSYLNMACLLVFSSGSYYQFVVFICNCYYWPSFLLYSRG